MKQRHARLSAKVADKKVKMRISEETKVGHTKGIGDQNI
jgi:hypothetical protein